MLIQKHLSSEPLVAAPGSRSSGERLKVMVGSVSSPMSICASSEVVSGFGGSKLGYRESIGAKGYDVRG